MPRLGYTKSRNGCARCRQRRVKCDEKRPCAACIRHDVRCSLLDNPPPPGAPSRRELPAKSRNCAANPSGSPESSAASVTTTGPRRSLTYFSSQSPSPAFLAGAPGDATEVPGSKPPGYVGSDGHSQAAQTPTAAAETAFPYFDKFLLPLGGETQAAWIQDLELMHHYSVVTALTLPRAQEELTVWQQQAPRLSFRYPFVMHQILAVAAFHMAYLQPERHGELFLHASQHQNRSIEGMRGLLSDINPENCHALFIASSLLLIGAFASFANVRPTSGSPPRVTVGQRPPTIEDMIDVFIMDRGVASVLQSSEPIIRAGYFRELFQFKGHGGDNPFMEQVTKELHALEGHISQDDGVSRVVRILVSLEITKLIDAVENSGMATRDSEMRVTTFWPITIAEDYITLLRQRNEAALLVLLVYCCVMNNVHDKNWFLKGWGISVAADINKHISPRWRDAVRWPFEQLALTGT